MKICLVRNDKMGDMILTLPVIQGLKEANEDYEIDDDISTAEITDLLLYKNA